MYFRNNQAKRIQDFFLSSYELFEELMDLWANNNTPISP